MVFSFDFRCIRGIFLFEGVKSFRFCNGSRKSVINSEFGCRWQLLLLRLLCHPLAPYLNKVWRTPRWRATNGVSRLGIGEEKGWSHGRGGGGGGSTVLIITGFRTRLFPLPPALHPVFFVGSVTVGVNFFYRDEKASGIKGFEERREVRCQIGWSGV